MNKILLLLLFAFSFLFSEEILEERAKLIYIKQEANLEQQNYVGQIIAIKYNILVLENSSMVSIGFLDSPRSNVTLKNPNSSWNELSDGSLENTFYFKINATNFYIPPLEVIANNNDFTEKETSQILRGSAISLNENHPKYSGVVAQNLQIDNYSVKFYDNNNNIIILDLRAEYSNLENFKIKDIKEQGFESSSFGIAKSSGIYYIIIPNNIIDFEFEYFELPSQSYKMLHIKNIINKEQISVNQDINPINKVLIFQNIIIFIVIFILLIAFFIRKIPFKLRLAGLIIAICLLLYLVIALNLKKDALIKTNSNITILPTKNSTIIEKVNANTRVEILSSHGEYYKITTSDGKIGWILKSEVD
ncbi:hypothetical protein CCY99_04645 [Helicobacter sp. 16-1353]|uniref:SH3 domain-containing protein n=1 Tax=Helicobacter sp. 16-1353 TaxID=2004996 RepID=UPI000DCCCAD9|nr:SH3 domain-containing protein [Helicobacter sp. 16-1353]RAX54304.1 hypothetical protein CCY99_04645 [Helicobacter sp. 16-1353]